MNKFDKANGLFSSSLLAMGEVVSEHGAMPGAKLAEAAKLPLELVQAIAKVCDYAEDGVIATKKVGYDLAANRIAARSAKAEKEAGTRKRAAPGIFLADFITALRGAGVPEDKILEVASRHLAGLAGRAAPVTEEAPNASEEEAPEGF